MRNVLIAATGLALLAAPSAALEFRGSDPVTTCEVWGNVNNPLASRSTLIRGGLDPDIMIEGVDPFFQFGPDGITLCEALAEKEPRKLCRENNRRGKTAENYVIRFSFERVVEDLNPPPAECNAPGDPECMELVGATQFRLKSFDGGQASGLCADLLP